jgi:hypothetical protein
MRKLRRWSSLPRYGRLWLLPRFRASAKCLRNPQCRKTVAERAKKLRDCLDKWINEFTVGTLQQLHDLLGDDVGADDSSEAIARRDRLESLLLRS